MAAGSNASKTAIQAWVRSGGNYYLIDQFCDLGDAEGLRDNFWRFARKCRPSLVLIEKTADGPALYARIRSKAKFEIKLISPQLAKGVRFGNHQSKIRAKKIFLPEDADWRHEFISEVVNLPGEFDDRIEAMSQYLDFMDTNPVIRPRPPRESGIAVVLASSIIRRR